MNQRGALELSINLLVVIIISLVILTSGIVFLYELIGGAEKVKGELDARTQSELDRLLIDEGKKVALPRASATLNAGETFVFGLGILNIEEEKFGQEFTLSVSLSKALDEEDAPLVPQPDTSSWPLYYPGPYTLKDNEHRSEPILIKIPKDAPKGTYIFNVKVTCEKEPADCDPYDTIKKFTVVVK